MKIFHELQVLPKIGLYFKSVFIDILFKVFGDKFVPRCVCIIIPVAALRIGRTRQLTYDEKAEPPQKGRVCWISISHKI